MEVELAQVNRKKADSTPFIKSEGDRLQAWTLGGNGLETLTDLVDHLRRDRGRGHLRLPDPRRDRADADGDVLERELGGHHLCEMGGCRLRAIVCELNESAFNNTSIMDPDSG